MDMGNKRALVLTGGGARGAYQAGVLKFVAEHVEDPEFKILLGSSAGAINVAALASSEGTFKDSVAHMEHVWSTLQMKDVLLVDFWSLAKMVLSWLANLCLSGILGRSFAGSLIDSSPLRTLIFKLFKPEVVSAAIESGKLEALAITATEVSTASSVTFVQAKSYTGWKRFNRRSEVTKINHKHILASSAIPFLFKSVRIGHKQYLDGSVRSTTPLGPAARLGATEIFSIGVRKVNTEDQAASDEVFESEPSMSQIGGLVLNSLFSDSLDSDAAHLNRINELLGLVDLAAAYQIAGMKPIDVHLVRPSQDIGKIAKEHLHRLPVFLRWLLKNAGSEKSESSDIVSYLLFDAEYAKSLIELGYRDATAKKDEILAFLKPVQHHARRVKRA